jgi:hypothetical protein
VTNSALLSVTGDRSRVVAAAAATPSVSTDGPRPSRSLRRRPAVWLIIVGLLALALGVGAVGAGAVGANRLDSVDATSVVAERADSAGGDPFTPPPTPGDAASEPAPPADAGSAPDAEGDAPTEDVPVSGDTVGLYGGTGAEACSAASMVTFFDTHPARAAAWARAQGIEPSDIGSFLSSLTPVVLRTDTVVTNHGFRDGRANAYQAVLEAGTAVLVDEHGVPRVRCACGNPLDVPEARDQVRYTGETWSELGQRPVTVIEPAAVIVESFVVVVVEQDTTVVVDRLRGTDGDHDSPAAPEAVEAALEFSVEDPANAESGEEPGTERSTGTGDEAVTDGSAGSDEEPGTDGSTGSGEEPGTDWSTGAGDEAATDGSASPDGESAADGSTGSGEESTRTGEDAATDGSAGTGGEPADDGSAGTGEEPATDGSAGTGEEAAADGSAGAGEEPATDRSGAGEEPATDGYAGTGEEAAAGESGG